MRLPVAVAKATPGRTRNDPSSERGAVATSPPTRWPRLSRDNPQLR